MSMPVKIPLKKSVELSNLVCKYVHTYLTHLLPRVKWVSGLFRNYGGGWRKSDAFAACPPIRVAGLSASGGLTPLEKENARF